MTTMTMFSSLKASPKRNLLFYLEIIHAASGFTKKYFMDQKANQFYEKEIFFSFRTM